MKSRTNNLLEIWSALSHDYALLCATSVVETKRDILRVTTGVQTRGSGFFLLDLPTLDGLLLTLLEEGFVRFQGPLTARRSKGDLRPRFLWSYWSRVCDHDGRLLDEPDADAIAAIRQLSSIFKKMETECTPDRVNTTVKEYLTNDARIIPAALDWAADSLDLTDVPTFVRNFGQSSSFFGISEGADEDYRGFLRRLDIVAGILVSELGSFDSRSENEFATGVFKHGPGAVSNLKGGSYKYDFPSWSEKLERLFPFDWCSGAQIGEIPPSRKESPSKLLAVPKTAKAPRLIAAEPVEHQFCQQKVFTWLDARFRECLIGAFLDLRDQESSKALVGRSSIDRSLSTIDLSSASDLVSCRHVESLLRSNQTLLDAAHAVRTRYVRDDVTSTGFINLKKYASMGSALTFPLESMFFLCIALACAGASSRASISKLRGKVRVFGDDIILPTTAYNDAVKYLTRLGLKVNQAKSFSKGSFRESCGADYWNGSDVTPLRPKTVVTDAARATQGMVDLSNAFHKKGLWRAAEAVLKMLPPVYRKNVFSHKRAVPGIFTYGAERLTKVKFCKHLHVDYVRVPCLLEKQERTAMDSSTTLREFFTRVWTPFKARELGVVQRKKAVLAFNRVVIHPM